MCIRDRLYPSIIENTTEGAVENQDYGQADPGMNFGPVAMNRGGIMSLRGY
jgi:hypothetical protein